MNRLFKALVLLCLSVGVAYAGWNIRQNDDGTTDWVRDSSTFKGEVEETIGSHHLTVQVADVSSSATTGFVVIPITDARISRIQAVLGTTITSASSTLTFSLIRAGTAISGEVTNAVSRLVLGSEGNGAAGFTHTFTPTANNSTTTSLRIQRGDVLKIATDGGSSTTSIGYFTITVEPY
jgi:hypothetical protein